MSGADLPEILNNFGIALARQGKAPAAQADLRRATDLDPDEDDYPFNLGLLAFRANDFPAAAKSFREAAEREPDNAEDRALLIQSLEKAGNKAEADEDREAAAEALGPNALPVIHIDAKNDTQPPLDRVKTDLDITALRLEIQSAPTAVTSAFASSATTPATPGTHIRRGRQELAEGHLDVAETEFRAALAADSTNTSAHRGLAEVDRRRGNLDDAIKELQASLASRDSAVVRTMLARVYLDQKKFDLARTEAQRALALAPNYADAKELLDHLQKCEAQWTRPVTLRTNPVVAARLARHPGFLVRRASSINRLFAISALLCALCVSALAFLFPSAAAEEHRAPPRSSN